MLHKGCLVRFSRPLSKLATLLSSTQWVFSKIRTDRRSPSPLNGAATPALSQAYVSSQTEQPGFWESLSPLTCLTMPAIYTAGGHFCSNSRGSGVVPSVELLSQRESAYEGADHPHPQAPPAAGVAAQSLLKAPWWKSTPLLRWNQHLCLAGGHFAVKAEVPGRKALGLGWKPSFFYIADRVKRCQVSLHLKLRFTEIWEWIHSSDQRLKLNFGHSACDWLLQKRALPVPGY